MREEALHNKQYGRNKQNSTSQAFLRKLHAIYVCRGTQSSSQWSQLIRGYLSSGFLREALMVYTKNLPRRTSHTVLPLVLKACGSLALLPLGASLHGESVKAGLIGEILVGTTFVSMYCKFGNLSDARKVFDEMPHRNVVTYNAMIGGCLMNGDVDSALVLFERSPERTPVTWVTMIDGFARVGDTVTARKLFDETPNELRNVVTWTVMVHGYAAKGEMGAAREMFECMPCRSFFVWSSMISGYFKKGDAKEARMMFDRIPERNLVNWNALIAGYAQIGCCEEALDAFREMQKDGFEPDEFTMASVLSACSQLGCLGTGKKIHDMINQKRINTNYFVLNGLVDMYAKCGDLERAKTIFNGMINRNVVCWNSMISGLATHGRSYEALALFDRMEESKKEPDNVTFLAALSACTHAGFVDRGLEIFRKMEKYGLAAGVEHYGCIVDLLGRAGRLNEAYSLVKSMPGVPNRSVWGALLGACKIHADKNMADRVLSDLNSNAEHDDDVKYIVLSNVNATLNKWEEAEKLWRVMAEKGMRKIPGCSSIMVGDIEHRFHSGAIRESQACVKLV
ncbi:pentatricopeptide repeat-containing protein At3g21470 [Dioscorea cayenensis subsp. rotundata]|uniref:Pentatricopeptide repeat-containing protein At3g21470 n=1 Tax=Dioscorea cayennensis subsp. rotundata TaxID=55577 RepID=A0AB40CCX6_DIOCR|nr:pentatricopeptide repeat-containing protein At3g21470 [Dioscorea cayenensis subsp. rotundata]